MGRRHHTRAQLRLLRQISDGVRVQVSKLRARIVAQQLAGQRTMDCVENRFTEPALRRLGYRLDVELNDTALWVCDGLPHVAVRRKRRPPAVS